ncbi:MAG: hypothetical protein GWM98_09390, partial [Nitrospinaceae bacterium]|nr:hypothetical protein [Nitrospinaceae bacterium]NIR54668.1 hypothetical protein [Nitrospinaceae bacterium]NIS85085.1 hypothetical protein [Nitrospinaceae bacterium]NIT81902.1 hypothetical protein [Nitrospinaceae bacterium]NIU44166.1 hypothetical protein [Nitrospinaceae bacterium]
FERASTLLEGETQRKTRIFLLTDLEKNGWDREEFPEKFGPQGTSVQIVDFSRDGEKSNRAAVQSA